MKDTAIAFSDWEAIRLSAGLKKEERRKKQEDRERTTVTTAGPFAESWPGQRLVFDPEVIRGKGYVRSSQTVLSGVQGYTFYKEDGTARFFRPEMLLIQKLAHKG